MNKISTWMAAFLFGCGIFTAGDVFSQWTSSAYPPPPESNKFSASNQYGVNYPADTSVTDNGAVNSYSAASPYYIPASHGAPNAGYPQDFPDENMVIQPGAEGCQAGCCQTGCGMGDGHCLGETDSGGLILPRLNQSMGMGCCSSILGPGAFFVDGYLDQGLTWGDSGPDNYPHVTNDRGNGYQLNQIYLSFGRTISRQECWAVGGQVDFMFGSDYFYVQSRGLETTSYNNPRWNGTKGNMTASRGFAKEYGSALPQAYFEVYSPWLQGISVKAGHFYSPLGYESAMPTNNFFYSHSYTSVYGLPATMTGVMTTTRVAPRMNLVLGAVNGWNASESVNDDFSFVGGITFDSYNQRFSIAALVMTGKQDLGLYGFHRYAWQGSKMESASVTVFNLHAKWQMTERLTYAVDFVAGSGKRELFTTFENEKVNWFGLSNYLFYQLDDCWALGFRFEWFNDAKDTMVIATDSGESVNYFSWTFGAKWTPLSWLTVRPEIRFDYCDYEQTWGGQKFHAFDNFSSSSQFTVGADMIIRF